MHRSAGTVAAGIALLSLSACGGATIEGTLTSPHGLPISGAKVTVEGQPCSGTTSDKGTFSLACDPGVLKLHLDAEGFTPARVTVRAKERQTYSSGLVMAMPLLSAEGYAQVEGLSLRPFPEHALRRTVSPLPEGGLDRRFCVEQSFGVEPMPLPDGRLHLAERRPAGATTARWRMLKLDAEGCAYRDQRNARMQWRETWMQKPAVHEEAYGDDHRWAEAQLAPGDWFLAGWNDFFVPLGEGDDRDRFKGAWLRVDAPPTAPSK